MKKIIISSVLVCTSIIGFAQENKEYKPNKDYLVGKFSDNWFVSGGIGTQIYLGEGLSSGSFFDHVSPAFELSFGKWFTPVMGVRAQINGINARGYNSLISPYVDGVANENGLYKMGFGYFSIHGDFLFNLSSQFYRYNTKRFYEAIPFVGFGLATSMNIEDKIYNNEFALSAGLINQFRINDKLDINLELKGMMVNQNFDGVSEGSIFEGTVGITAGLSYKFGHEKEFKSASIEPIAPMEAIENNSNKVLEDKNTELKKQIAEQQKKIDDYNNSLEKDSENINRLKKELESLKNTPKSIEAIDGNFRVFYEIGSTQLDDYNSANLEYVSEVIKKSNKKHIIKGYADSSTGKQSVNEKIANKRAENVCNILVERYGIKKDLLSIESYVVEPENRPEMVRMCAIKVIK